MVVRDAFTGSLRPFTLQVSLSHAILDSNYCFAKKEVSHYREMVIGNFIPVSGYYSGAGVSPSGTPPLCPLCG